MREAKVIELFVFIDSCLGHACTGACHGLRNGSYSLEGQHGASIEGSRRGGLLLLF